MSVSITVVSFEISATLMFVSLLDKAYEFYKHTTSTKKEQGFWVNSVYSWVIDYIIFYSKWAHVTVNHWRVLLVM